MFTKFIAHSLDTTLEPFGADQFKIAENEWPKIWSVHMVIS